MYGKSRIFAVWINSGGMSSWATQCFIFNVLTLRSHCLAQKVLLILGRLSILLVHVNSELKLLVNRVCLAMNLSFICHLGSYETFWKIKQCLFYIKAKRMCCINVNAFSKRTQCTTNFYSLHNRQPILVFYCRFYKVVCSTQLTCDRKEKGSKDKYLRWDFRGVYIHLL